jgi:hypothetical protein
MARNGRAVQEDRVDRVVRRDRAQRIGAKQQEVRTFADLDGAEAGRQAEGRCIVERRGAQDREQDARSNQR